LTHSSIDIITDLLLAKSGDIGEDLAQSGREPSVSFARLIIEKAYKEMSKAEFERFASAVIKHAAIEEIKDVTGHKGLQTLHPSRAALRSALLDLAGGPGNRSTPAKAAKVAEINKYVGTLIGKFKHVVEKDVGVKELKVATSKLVKEYVGMKSKPVECPMAIAGGVFYYAARSKAGKITHGAVKQDDVAKAVRFSVPTIRKVTKVFEDKHGKNGPRA